MRARQARTRVAGCGGRALPSAASSNGTTWRRRSTPSAAIRRPSATVYRPSPEAGILTALLTGRSSATTIRWPCRTDQNAKALFEEADPRRQLRGSPPSPAGQRTGRSVYRVLVGAATFDPEATEFLASTPGATRRARARSRRRWPAPCPGAAAREREAATGSTSFTSRRCSSTSSGSRLVPRSLGAVAARTLAEQVTVVRLARVRWGGARKWTLSAQFASSAVGEVQRKAITSGTGRVASVGSPDGHPYDAAETSHGAGACRGHAGELDWPSTWVDHAGRDEGQPFRSRAVGSRRRVGGGHRPHRGQQGFGLILAPATAPWPSNTAVKAGPRPPSRADVATIWPPLCRSRGDRVEALDRPRQLDDGETVLDRAPGGVGFIAVARLARSEPS